LGKLDGKISNEIIEEVCAVIENNYPIEPKSLTDDEIESPSLINGIVYYDLENWIADKIKKLK